MYKLQVIDELTLPDHYYLDHSDTCYFFGTYTSRESYSYSETNQLIFNFKKDIKYKGTNSWKYKEEAINNIRLLLSSTFSQNESLFSDSTIVPIPPSKAKHDPAYDDRLVSALNNYFNRSNDMNIRALELVLLRGSMESSHTLANRPPPQTIIDNMYIDPEINKAQIRDRIIIFDDVLTTGSHFKAAQQVIKNEFPEKDVIGLFIARREIPDSFADLNELLSHYDC